MKRRAFLFALLSVFALTSCSLLPNMTPSRRNKSSSEESAEVSGSSKNTRHTHNYSDWVVTVAPTCTQDGVEERYCTECGQSQTRSTYRIGHDFQEQMVIKEPTCTEDGIVQYRCTRCDATEIREIKGGHDWSAPTYHGFVDDQVQYNSYQCLRCFEYSKIEFAAIDGTLASGSAIKSGTPEGFMKLQGNNQSISWKFDLSSLTPASSYYGILYQRACMDSFSNNTSRTYGSYSTSSSATTEEGNFKVEINGEVVDKTPYMSITYGELLAEGEDSSWLGDNYSPIALCPIGQVFLNGGINEMRYTRIGSYNLTILDFVMVISPFDHEHLASSTWFCDNEYHWHECVNAGCPLVGRRLDESAHVWGEKYDEVAATCEVNGSYKERCTICAYERTVETNATGHNWINDESIEAVQPTKTSSGHYAQRCTVCNQTREIETVYGETKETALTVDEAIEIGSLLPVRAKTEKTYYVKGVISEIAQIAEANGYVTIWLSSSSADRGFEFYHVSIMDKDDFDFNDIVVGAEVLGHGQIYNYREGNIEFSGAGCYLDEVLNKAQQVFISGSYCCVANLVNDSTIFINIALSGGLAYVRIGSSTIFNTTYTYNPTLSKISIYLDEAGYGTFKATYSNNTLTSGHFSGSYGTQLTENGNLLFNTPQVLFGCEGTDEELQSVFKRRYRPNDAWVIDTNNADRITSYSDATMGNCLRLRPYADGAVALNKAEDFETPLECSSIGFWVYNSSENNITLRMWMYKGAGHTSAIEIGNVTAVAGQWTYCFMGFSTLSTYNFQIADFTNSGTALLFKNICFFA